MDERKVIFSLTKPQDLSFDPDRSEEEVKQSNERCREREGRFHGWHDIEVKSAQSDNYLVERIALIEDLKTGKIHEVTHEYFQFINN